MTNRQRLITRWAVATAITFGTGPAFAQEASPPPAPSDAVPASGPPNATDALPPVATPATVNDVALPRARPAMAPSAEPEFTIESVVWLEPGAVAKPPRTWYQGNAGRRRMAHLGVLALTGIGYAASETVLKPVWAAKACEWCNPPGIDTSVRDALKWNDTKLAARIADLDGYLLAPLFGLGSIWLSSIDDHGNDGRVARWLDDGIPIVEALTFAQLAVQAFKFTSARQRPFVHFSDPARPHETDDNMSFISGHSALAFSVATSAGMVAHRRGYQLEPVIWAVGFTLAGSTAYLRIAADKHYFTDVLAGSVLGSAFGVAVPLLLHSAVLRRHQLNVAPTGNGMMISGAF